MFVGIWIEFHLSTQFMKEVSVRELNSTLIHLRAMHFSTLYIVSKGIFDRDGKWPFHYVLDIFKVIPEAISSFLLI